MIVDGEYVRLQLDPVQAGRVGLQELAVRLALQLALVPPLVLLQFQFHGPLPVTVVGVPEEQSQLDGADG